MTFEEADGCVVIRPVPKRACVEVRLREARGVAGADATTDDVMRLTRLGTTELFLVDSNALLDISAREAGRYRAYYRTNPA